MPSGQKVESASVARRRLRAIGCAIRVVRARERPRMPASALSGDERDSALEIAAETQRRRSAEARRTRRCVSPARAASTALGPEIRGLQRPRTPLRASSRVARRRCRRVAALAAARAHAARATLAESTTAMPVEALRRARARGRRDSARSAERRATCAMDHGP